MFVEQALFDPVPKPAVGTPVIADKTADVLAQNYFACVQDAGGGCLPAGNPIPEIPTALTSTKKFTDAGLNAGLVPEDAAGNKSYYMIERMCSGPGAEFASTCNLSTGALGADAGTQHYEGLKRIGGAYYRVTVRVEGPRNTVAYAQAIVK